MTLEKRMELLAKNQWDYHDIMLYADVGATKAIAIKNKAIREHGGGVKYMSHRVTVDSVLECLGTTREKEVEIVSRLIKSNEPDSGEKN